MTKEVNLPTNPEQLTEALIKAASEEDWDQVDAIAPIATKMPAERLIRFLGEASWSDNPNVRDAVMTAWSYLEPQTPPLKLIHLRRALKVMLEDPAECPAVWAAVTIARYADESNPLETIACPSLKEFEIRIAEMDKQEGGTEWQETRNFVVEKTKNRVPQLAEFI